MKLFEIHDNETWTLTGITEDGQLYAERKMKAQLLQYINRQGSEGLDDDTNTIDLPDEPNQKRVVINRLLDEFAELMDVHHSRQEILANPDTQKWIAWTMKYAHVIIDWGIEYDTNLSSIQ